MTHHIREMASVEFDVKPEMLGNLQHKTMRVIQCLMGNSSGASIGKNSWIISS